MSTDKISPRGREGTKLADALTEAQSIIGAAEDRAREIQDQAERVREDAERRGYSDGLERGRREVADRAVRLLEERSKLEEQLADEAARLAAAICEKAIGEHLRVTPDIVRRLAVKALRETVVGEAATIIVHADDHELIKSNLGELRRAAGGAVIQIDTDSSLTRGGCVIRTEFGEVDASIESLLDAVLGRLGLQAS